MNGPSESRTRPIATNIVTNKSTATIPVTGFR